MVDALFVDARGVYPRLLGAEHCWDEERDARTYAGPGPLLLHPPCAAWCQLAGLREARYGYPRGEDGGLFAYALQQLFAFGGVLEHPAYSKAWPAHALVAPYGVGWCYVPDKRSIAGRGGYHVCRVSQCAYGHRARKRTWLLYAGQRGPFDLDWSEPYVPNTVVISGAKNHKQRPCERMWTREAKATPEPFARALIALAEWSRNVA